MPEKSMPQVMRYLLAKGYTIEEYFDKHVVKDKKGVPMITLTKAQLATLIIEVPLEEVSRDGKITFIRSLPLLSK